MQSRNRSREVTIVNPLAAAVFTQSPARRVLLQFAQQPRSVAEVAASVGMDLKQLHHSVTRLCRLGLLAVVEERSRAGRPVKYYQCTGSSYFIPSAVAPRPFSRGLAQELQAAIERDAAATIEGMTFSLDAEGRVTGHPIAKRGGPPPPLNNWRILRMSAAQARQLKLALTEVLDRFQREADNRGEVYLVHAGMARRVNHQGPTDNGA